MSKAELYEMTIGVPSVFEEGLEHRIDVEMVSQSPRLKRITTLYENKAKCLDYTLHNNRYLTPSLVKKARKQLAVLLDTFYKKYGFELYLEQL